MKKDIHPEEYRFVVFKDMSNDYAFLSKSAAATSETIKWEDGNEYPLIKLEISHKSHPFYTGKMQLVDTAGRIDKFKNRYAKHSKKQKDYHNVQKVSVFSETFFVPFIVIFTL
eukprot:TRINITY_DN36554_c0_g1_i1.p1 TRINITY_DN36554_c0_g1~~TRINITY_DN36554_c0_g1_i1.p1  ORF type:complete len:125 (-),score=5.35 TRINITY_DN36554_c0_g1_i1:39-377(-)